MTSDIRCPKCFHLGVRYCGDADTGLFDELTQLQLYGCIECGLIFLDSEWSDEHEEWWQNTNNIPFKENT